MSHLETVKEIVQPNTAFPLEFRSCGFYFLRITDPRAFGDFIGKLIDHGLFETRAGVETDLRCTIGLTAQGLHRINVPKAIVAALGLPFNTGMAKRYVQLRDKGENAPENWNWPLGNSVVDAVLQVHSRNADDEPFDHLVQLLGDEAQPASEYFGTKSGCVYLSEEIGRRKIEGGFAVNSLGFADGVSQPATELDPAMGQNRPSDESWISELSEFFVSLSEADGTPALETLKEPWKRTRARARSSGYRGGAARLFDRVIAAMTRGGTFLVYRNIQVENDKFRSQCDELGAQLGISTDDVANQLVGRTKDADPLVKQPINGQPNNFDFSDDLQGLVCPLDSHVRTVNPRAGVDPESGVPLQRSTTGKPIFGKHKMIRRGITSGDRSGLHFVAIVSDLEEQFEFVQREWINKGDFKGHPSSTVDILAATSRKKTQFEFVVNGNFVEKSIETVSSLKGGEYFFVPGQGFLNLLASHDIGMPWPAIPDEAPSYIGGSVLSDPFTALDRVASASLGGIPVVNHEGVYFVARWDDALNILNDGERFSSFHYLRRIRELTGGEDFALGMNHLEDNHTAQRGEIDNLLDLDLLDKVWPEGVTHGTAGGPAIDGLTDLLFQLTWPKLVEMVETYLNVKVPDDPSDIAISNHLGGLKRERYKTIYPEEIWKDFYPFEKAAQIKSDNLRAVVRRMGRYIIGLSESDIIFAQALAAAADFRTWQRDSDEPGMTLVQGLAVAMCGTIEKATAHVFDCLLSEPDVRDMTRDVVNNGSREELIKIIREILRLHPVLPIVARHATRPVTLHGSAVPKGAPIYIVAEAALRDPRRFGGDADRFSLAHEFDGELVFGYGPHRCNGEELSLHFIARTVEYVVRNYEMRRPAGDREALQYENQVSSNPVALYAKLKPRA